MRLLNGVEFQKTFLKELINKNLEMQNNVAKDGKII